MATPLAIVAPRVGAPSETFIRRHMVDLLPGRTALVVNSVMPANGVNWTVQGPVLAVNQMPAPGLAARLLRFAVPSIRHSPMRHFTRQVRRFLREQGVSTVLGEFLSHSLPYLPIARDAGCRFWAHAHGWDISAAVRLPEWREGYRQYREADGVITMSEFSRRRLIGLGLDPSRVHTIPYGVDVPDQPPRRSRTESPLVRCLAVGRMVTKKAPILVLAAFRQAAVECPDLRLDLIGDGELYPAVRQFVEAYRMSDRVTLHGAQSHDRVRALMQEADIFVQHSITDPDSGDEEGLPVAILEAMSFGLPVLSTRHAGIPEAVIEGVTGMLVEEGDVDGMARALVAMGKDRDKRVAFGEAGWSQARERFSWQRERTDLLRVLEMSA